MSYVLKTHIQSQIYQLIAMLFGREHQMEWQI
jgi:hypothetical protein